MQRRSPSFFARVVFVVLIFLLIGHVILQYLKGYEGHALVFGADELIAPPQGANRMDPEIIQALQFLSRRWNTTLDTIYVLAVRQIGAIKEVGIVESNSLSSARLIIPVSSPPNLEQLSADSIAHNERVYLMNEFRPESPQEKNISRTFYTTNTPSLGTSKDFAVIVWWNVATSGSGHINALTNSGYLNVPVMGGVLFKRLGSYTN